MAPAKRRGVDRARVGVRQTRRASAAVRQLAPRRSPRKSERAAAGRHRPLPHRLQRYRTGRAPTCATAPAIHRPTHLGVRLVRRLATTPSRRPGLDARSDRRSLVGDWPGNAGRRGLPSIPAGPSQSSTHQTSRSRSPHRKSRPGSSRRSRPSNAEPSPFDRERGSRSSLGPVFTNVP